LEFKNTIDNHAAILNRELEANFEALRSIAILFSYDKKPNSNPFDLMNLLKENGITQQGAELLSRF